MVNSFNATSSREAVSMKITQKKHFWAECSHQPRDNCLRLLRDWSSDMEASSRA